MNHRIEKIEISSKSTAYKEINATALSVFKSPGNLPVVALNHGAAKKVKPGKKFTCQLMNLTLPRGMQLLQAKVTRKSGGKATAAGLSQLHQKGPKYLWKHKLKGLTEVKALQVPFIRKVGANNNSLPSHPRRLAIPHHCSEDCIKMIRSYPPPKRKGDDDLSVQDLGGRVGACSKRIDNFLVKWNYAETYDDQTTQMIQNSLAAIGCSDPYSGTINLLANSLPNNDITWVPLEVTKGQVSERDLIYFYGNEEDTVYSLDRFTYLDGPDIYVGRLPDKPVS